MPLMKQNPSDEMLASDERLRTVVARVLDRAAAKDASAAEAGANLDTGLSVNVRLGEVETIEYQRDRGLGVTVYFGNCKGSASSADLSEAAIVETVDKACSIASFTAADDCAGLADAELMADAVPDLDLYHPWGLTPDAAIEQAQRCEAAALDLDPRLNNSEGSSVATHANLHVYGNSHGFLGAYPSTSHSVSCAVLGQDENGMQRDYWYTSARDFAELRPAEEVGRVAGERALELLGNEGVELLEPDEGDFLGKGRRLSLIPGDLLAVRSAGAYGFTMSSNYNSRPRAAEIMVDGDLTEPVPARSAEGLDPDLDTLDRAKEGHQFVVGERLVTVLAAQSHHPFDLCVGGAGQLGDGGAPGGRVEAVRQRCR